MDERIKATGLIERLFSKDVLSSKELLSHLRKLELFIQKGQGLLMRSYVYSISRYFQLPLAQQCLRARR